MTLTDRYRVRLGLRTNGDTSTLFWEYFITAFPVVNTHPLNVKIMSCVYISCFSLCLWLSGISVLKHFSVVEAYLILTFDGQNFT